MKTICIWKLETALGGMESQGSLEPLDYQMYLSLSRTTGRELLINTPWTLTCLNHFGPPPAHLLFTFFAMSLATPGPRQEGEIRGERTEQRTP